MKLLRLAADTITLMLLIIGATVLVLMMLLTAWDVLLRYLFNRPVSGAFELIEYMMAVFIPFSVVYCARRREHVAVDLIMNFFGADVRRGFECLTSLVTAIFAGLVTWQCSLYVGSMLKSKMTSAVLLIPVYPFVAAVTIGMGAFALVTLINILTLFKPEPAESASAAPDEVPVRVTLTKEAP